MRRLGFLSLLLLAPFPALATGPDCGGDAYSSAQVGPNPPGPLTAVPDTLCADLEEVPRAGTRIEIYGTGAPYPPPYGDRLAPAPYEGRPPFGPRPRSGRDPER